MYFLQSVNTYVVSLNRKSIISLRNFQNRFGIGLRQTNFICNASTLFLISDNKAELTARTDVQSAILGCISA